MISSCHLQLKQYHCKMNLIHVVTLLIIVLDCRYNQIVVIFQLLLITLNILFWHKFVLVFLKLALKPYKCYFGILKVKLHYHILHIIDSLMLTNLISGFKFYQFMIKFIIFISTLLLINLSFLALYRFLYICLRQYIFIFYIFIVLKYYFLFNYIHTSSSVIMLILILISYLLPILVMIHLYGFCYWEY